MIAVLLEKIRPAVATTGSGGVARRRAWRRDARDRDAWTAML